MTQAELARRMDRPLKTINEITKGKAAITPETALQLELVLGIPASFWNNLEVRYREYLAREEISQQFDREADWTAQFPIQDMVQRKLLSETSSGGSRLSELLRFFGVSSPGGWERQWKNAAVSFRQSAAFESSPAAVSVWLRQGEVAAEKIECMPFDGEKLKRALSEIRSLTRMEPLGFRQRLIDILRSCGVALVFTHELQGTHISGASRWLTPEKALVQLSLRHRRDDQFWFTLFHELGHILYGNKRHTYLHAAEKRPFDHEEDEVDRFAASQLIANDEYQRIRDSGDLSASVIEGEAQRLGISPGILLGRLQRDRRLPWSAMNYLKKTFQWTDDAAE